MLTVAGRSSSGAANGDPETVAGDRVPASAVGAVLAAALLKSGEIPRELTQKETLVLNGKGILLLGLGRFVTAVAVHEKEILP